MLETNISKTFGISPPMRNFRLRLKDKHDVRDVIIQARDLDWATKVGNLYCDKEKYRFIRVEPMVVADETLLQ